MNLQITTTTHLSGGVTPPSSKSQTIRAILLALLAKGTSNLKNPLDSEDTRNALEVAKQLGAHITQQNNSLCIQSGGIPLTPEVKNQIPNKRPHLNSGNSGITTLFTLPLLGLRKNNELPIIFDCGEQMRLRPVAPLIQPLLQLGLTIQSLGNAKTLPIQVSGELIGGDAQVDGSTSQYLSALLMALPCAKNDSVIRVKNLCERPYVEMTLRWLDQQEILYAHHTVGHIDEFSIQGRQQYRPFQTTISGDFSSASYLIAAGVLIPGCIELQGLNMHEPQGDKRLVHILQQMGADILIQSDRLIIQGGKPLKGISIDASDIPDLLPTLAVIGTYASEKTDICKVAHARIKETDRICSMADGLTRLGAKLLEQEDGLTIYQSSLKGALVKGYGDHRTVMALSLAGMIAQGRTVIEGKEAIDKTFPTFVQRMKSLGAQMEEVSCN